MDDARTAATLRRLFARRLARQSLLDRSYGDPRGTAALRAEIATYLGAARGVKCDADQVIVTAGSQQGLDLVVRAVLAPGDPVWIEDPCYPMALAAFRGAGLAVTGVPVDGEGLSVAAGEAMRPRARAVYVTPSHQFPLGVAMTMARRLALIDWAKRVGAWIFEDDYDSEFRHAGAPLASLQGIDDGGRVVYLGTFSKALTPALRVGYVVAPPALTEAIVAVKARTDRFAPRLIEDVLAALMAEGHFTAHIRRARRRARDARDALVAGLAATPLAVIIPDQGLHLIADLPDGLSDAALVPALRAAGLGARALSACFVEAPPRQGLVIGFSGFAPEVLEAAARGIAPVIERAMEDATRSSQRRAAGE
jgi:GntR family transcriptional regulator/MocR family aminotransferase